MDAPDRKKIFDIADQFIHLANELSQKHSLEEVSTAMRYAASRYNAFEVSQRAPDILLAREDAIQWFTEQYNQMFIDNIDQIIDQQHREKN